MIVCPACNNQNQDDMLKIDGYYYVNVSLTTKDVSESMKSKLERIRLLGCANCGCVIADGWMFNNKNCRPEQHQERVK